MSIKVVDLPVTDLRDPAKVLRRIADEIDAGDYGIVTSLGVVSYGDTLEVFGAGQDSQGTTIALLFNAAALRFAREIEQNGITT